MLNTLMAAPSWLRPIDGIDRTEKLIEDITEVALEYLDFCLGDRHLLWPVVNDGPGGRIVLRAAALWA